MENTKRNQVMMRVYPEVNEKMKQWSRELSAIQKQEISMAELLRRVTNVPDIDKILAQDAERKRMSSGGRR